MCQDITVFPNCLLDYVMLHQSYVVEQCQKRFNEI